MNRNIALAVVLSLVFIPLAEAAQGKRSVTELVAELKKGEKEKFAAIDELAALGGKAADAGRQR